MLEVAFATLYSGLSIGDPTGMPDEKYARGLHQSLVSILQSHRTCVFGT